MNSQTGKAKLIVLIVALVLISVPGIYVYQNRSVLFPKQRAPFPSIGLKLLQSTNRSYAGDNICDSRINEPTLYPDDCIAQFMLDTTLSPESQTLTGTLTVRNTRPELRNLQQSQIRCYKDAYAEKCTLTKEQEGDSVTTYRVSAEKAYLVQAGFVPIGVEIKLDETFHVAAIDWVILATSNGYNFKPWGLPYRAVLIPLTIDDQSVSQKNIETIKTLLTTTTEKLNQEAQRLGKPGTFSLVLEMNPPCAVNATTYETTMGLSSHCGIQSANETWYKNTFTVLISPRKSCPNFQVVAKEGDQKIPVPATYGLGGDICISTHSDWSNDAMVANLFHEFLHAFGAADHYDWLYGKNPDYTCNVAQGTTVCPVAVEEIGWR